MSERLNGQGPGNRLKRVAGTAKTMSVSKWAALARAAPWVLTTRVALGVVPWKKLSSALDGNRVKGGEPDLERAQDTIWAVHAVSRRVLPDRPCLTQALVARRLLRGCGLDPTLRIGAVRHPDGEIGAHAWLEHDGKVILGWSGVEYAPFESRRGRPMSPDKSGAAGAARPAPTGERTAASGAP